MISFMLATTLVVFITSTLTEKQSFRCIATCRRTAEDGSCSKGDRMHLSASIAIGMTIDQSSETLERISGWETTKFIVSPQQMRCRDHKITVIGYNGTYGDSLRYHNNMMFSTRDRDNDMWKTRSCSNDLTGGWWFNDCHNSNLNGQFIWNTKAYSGIGWVRLNITFP